MSRVESSSIWDRLSVAHKSSRSSERGAVGDRPSRFGPTATKDFKQAVCRDLESLLNTRRPLLPTPDAAGSSDEILRRSLANYGIPDFTGAYMASREQREMFRRELLRAIAVFEPRIQSVRVEEIQPKDAGGNAATDRTLRFRITGIIRSPSPGGRGFGGATREEAVFETRIEPMTCGVAVERTK